MFIRRRPPPAALRMAEQKAESSGCVAQKNHNSIVLETESPACHRHRTQDARRLEAATRQWRPHPPRIPSAALSRAPARASFPRRTPFASDIASLRTEADPPRRATAPVGPHLLG